MNTMTSRVFYDPAAKTRPYRVESDGEELGLTLEEATALRDWLTVALEAGAVASGLGRPVCGAGLGAADE